MPLPFLSFPFPCLSRSEAELGSCRPVKPTDLTHALLILHLDKSIPSLTYTFRRLLLLKHTTFVHLRPSTSHQSVHCFIYTSFHNVSLSFKLRLLSTIAMCMPVVMNSLPSMTIITTNTDHPVDPHFSSPAEACTTKAVASAPGSWLSTETVPMKVKHMYGLLLATVVLWLSSSKLPLPTPFHAVLAFPRSD
jgi:hypothetical protein